MQEYMYSVFFHCIKEPMGFDIVLCHHGDRNPQHVYVGLRRHYIDSPAGILRARNILSGITIDIIPSTCTLSINHYIITAFFDNVKTYNAMVTGHP